MRIYEPIAGIEGVASGAAATVSVPVNRRLHLLRLFATATDGVPSTVYGADVISDIQVYVAGRLIRTVTAQELLDRAAFEQYNISPDVDGVPMYFSEPKRASVMDEQVTAWDLWGRSNMTLKVNIKSGLTNPSLSAIMVHDDGFTTNAQGNRVLNIVRMTPFFFNAGTSYDITALDIDKPIQRMFIYPEAGNAIQSVKVVVNNVQTVHEMTASENAAFLEDYDLVANTGNGDPFPVVFDANGQLFDGLPVVQALRVTVKSSGAGQLKVLLENRATDYI